MLRLLGLWEISFGKIPVREAYELLAGSFRGTNSLQQWVAHQVPIFLVAALTSLTDVLAISPFAVSRQSPSFASMDAKGKKGSV